MLTNTERKIMDLMNFGHTTTKQLSEELKVAESTIYKHFSHIFEKLNVSNRTEALLIYSNKKES